MKKLVVLLLLAIISLGCSNYLPASPDEEFVFKNTYKYIKIIEVKLVNKEEAKDSYYKFDVRVQNISNYAIKDFMVDVYLLDNSGKPLNRSGAVFPYLEPNYIDTQQTLIKFIPEWQSGKIKSEINGLTIIGIGK